MISHGDEPGAFEDRLLASLTDIDSRRPKIEPVAGAAPARTRPLRLLRPAVLGVTAALAIAGAVVAAGVIAPRLFEPSGVPQVAGDQLAAKGSGCAASATVTVSLDGQVIGTVKAFESGDFSASVPIPADTTAGRHDVTVSCPAGDGSQVVQTAAIEVVTERPPLGPVMNANLVTATQGGTVTLNIGPVKAGTDVAVTLDGKPLTTLHATADGRLVAPLTVPADIAIGDHLFRATGTVPDGRTFDQTTEVSVTAG
jgi:hypothetical protein